MILTELNWLAIVVAFVAFFIIGSIWFGPKTFYPVWAKALGVDPGKMGPNAHGMALVFGLTALGALVQVLAVAIVIEFASSAGPVGPLGGAAVGLLLGVGIAAAGSLSHRLFSGQGLRAWAIEAGGDVVALTVAGLIVGVLG